MSGVEDWQWLEVKKGLDKIDDLGIAINQVHVEIAELNTELFGKNKDNGMKGDIKENKERIEKLEKKPEEKRKRNIPLIISIIALLTSPLWGFLWGKILGTLP
jgi:hypothetical protein